MLENKQDKDGELSERPTFDEVLDFTTQKIINIMPEVIRINCLLENLSDINDRYFLEMGQFLEEIASLRTEENNEIDGELIETLKKFLKIDNSNGEVVKEFEEFIEKYGNRRNDLICVVIKGINNALDLYNKRRDKIASLSNILHRTSGEFQSFKGFIEGEMSEGETPESL